MPTDNSNAVSVEIIGQYLQQYGWGFQITGDQELRCGFRGKHKTYQVQIELTDTWVQFKINPLLFVTQDWHYWPEILHYLLQMNDITQLTKLSLDQEGMIILSIQALAVDFDYHKFELNLGILGYYADAIYEELIGFFQEIGFSRQQPSEYLI